MQRTLNRIKEGSQGTERMQGNMEQSPASEPVTVRNSLFVSFFKKYSLPCMRTCLDVMYNLQVHTVVFWV